MSTLRKIVAERWVVVAETTEEQKLKNSWTVTHTISKSRQAQFDCGHWIWCNFLNPKSKRYSCLQCKYPEEDHSHCYTL